MAAPKTTSAESEQTRAREGRPVLLGAVVLAAAAAVAYFAFSDGQGEHAPTQAPAAADETSGAEGSHADAQDTSSERDPSGARPIEAPGSAERPPQPQAAIVRSPADRPAPSSEGFDPNKAFPGEGPMRVIDMEQQSPQRAEANVPSASERLSMTNSTIERLQAQLDDAEQSGDSARAQRLRVRLARLERQRAAHERASQGNDGAAP